MELAPAAGEILDVPSMHQRVATSSTVKSSQPNWLRGDGRDWLGRLHVRLPLHPKRGRELLAQRRRRRDARVRKALGHVGLQLYPGLFWPPVLLPTQTAGGATAEALTLLRTCWMPMAQLGADVPIWVSENGYATNLGHDEARQVTDLDATLSSVHALDTTLGVTDYRYFNLRDNRPNGTDLFDDVGLLRADYSAKPAFAAFRNAIVSFASRTRRSASA